MAAKSKDDLKLKFQATMIEIIFWVAALTTAFFINISPQALKITNPAFLIVLLVAFLAILSANFLPTIASIKNKVIFSGFVYVVVFLAVFLFFNGATMWLVYYYLPIMIAFAMAFLVIVKPRGSTTVLIAVCIFFLGEVFWNIQVGSEKRIFFPPAFLRVYSLTLVTIFGYYLYNREQRAQLELKILNRKLEDAGELKSDFVANVSHELRTPITSIKNACVLLKKINNNLKSSGQNTQKFMDTSADELLEIIDLNIDRQSRLIDELLDLAKIEKGKALYKRVLIDVSTIASQVVNSLAMQAKAKNIILEADIQPNIPKIYASGDQIIQVYTNLIDNAIKYTKKGGHISLKIIAQDHSIKSIISDTGIGISQENICKLFNRFVRPDAILEYGAKGTGLGLAITKEILDLHGGCIWVESAIGHGSKFIFTLPYGLRQQDK